MEKLKSVFVTLLVAVLCVVGVYWSLRPGGELDIPDPNGETTEEIKETWTPEEIALFQRFLEDVGVTFDEDEQYIIEYTSNGDGTCAVTDVLFNPFCREEIVLVIPEVSPDGDTVVSISTTLSSPDFGVPPILTRLFFEDLQGSFGEAYGYGSEAAGAVSDFYSVYDQGLAENPEEYEAMLRRCPLLEWTPCAVLDTGAYGSQLIGIAERARYAGGLLDTVDYLLAYYKLFDVSSGEGRQYLLDTWDVRNALKDPARLSRVEMPDTVTEIAVRAFMGCHALREVRLSENLKQIPKEAFRGAGLFEIDVPDNVQVIGEYAFNGCFSLVRAQLGAGLRDIRSGAFWCPKLFEIQNRSVLRIESSVSGGGYGNISDYARWVYIEDYEGSRIVRDGDFVFYVSEEAGEYLLLDYRGDASEVELPNGVKGHAYGISGGAFRGEVKLRSVRIGNGVTFVSSGAFEFCTALETVELGGTVGTVEEGAFAASCPRITAFLTDGDNPHYESVDGILYTEGLSMLCRYPAGREDGQFTVPDGVGMLTWDAFDGASSLGAVEIPSSVEKVFISAFFGNGDGGIDVIYHGTQEEWLGVAHGCSPCPEEYGGIKVSCLDGDLWFSSDY